MQFKEYKPQYQPVSADKITLTIPEYDFGKDSTKVQSKPNEDTVTMLDAPLDRPEDYRVAFRHIPNIYNGTGISPKNQAPSRKGLSILVQNTCAHVIENPDDPSLDGIVLPSSAHVVLKFPNSEFITEEVLRNQLQRVLSALLHNLNKQMRGGTDLRA